MPKVHKQVKEPATDTAAPADVIPFDQGEERKTKESALASGLTNIDPERFAIVKSNLDLAWGKIQNALQQEAEGHKLWIEGTLELINILDDARKRLGSDQAFGTWLTDNQICTAMNVTKNAAPAIVKQKIENRISITPLLALSVSGHTPASISAQRFLVRKLDAVENSST